jgi:GntR family transcriptional regulator/MocR family aminotransferase
MIAKALSAIAPDRNNRASLQTQLCLRLKGVIQSCSFSPGEPLPSSRELALDLRVSRNTVIAACDRLVGEGYLEARPRSGLFVIE